MNLAELRQQLFAESEAETVDLDRSLASLRRRISRQRRRRHVARATLALALVTMIAGGVGLVVREDDGVQLVVGAEVMGPRIAVLSSDRNGPQDEWRTRVSFIDPATGTSRDVEVPENNYGEYPVGLLQVGDRLLLSGRGVVRGSSHDLSLPVEDVTPALVFVPAARSDRIWIISDWHDRNAGPYTLTEIDAHGEPTTPAAVAPERAGWPLAGTTSGLLLYGPDDTVLLWDPVTATVTQTITDVVAYPGNGWAARTSFVWLAGCTSAPRCDHLVIRDLISGEEVTVAPPPGTTAFLPVGSLSPDGATLAVVVTDPAGISQLALVDLPSLRALTVPGSTSAGTAVSWAPDGTTLYFGTQEATAIAQHRPGEVSASVVTTGLTAFSNLTVVVPPATPNEDGTIDGVLIGVGGPPPGGPRPLSGRIALHRDGRLVGEVAVRAGEQATFTFEVPPGTYDLAASFGPTGSSCAEQRVDVAPGVTTPVALTCHLR